jgi:sulfur carrier protein
MPTSTKQRSLGPYETRTGTRRLIVNGEPVQSDAETLAALLNEIGLADVKVATALNGDFVPATKRSAQSLSDGDRVEIVSARQGG